MAKEQLYNMLWYDKDNLNDKRNLYGATLSQVKEYLDVVIPKWDVVTITKVK